MFVSLTAAKVSILFYPAKYFSSIYVVSFGFLLAKKFFFLCVIKEEAFYLLFLEEKTRRTLAY